MAARSRRNSARSRIVAALWARARPPLARSLRALALPGAVLLLMGAAIWRLETHVARAHAAPGVQIEWAELPDWLADSGNAHVLDDLSACCGVSESDDWNDPTLAQRVAENLSRPKVGWVREVRRVIKAPGGLLRVYCDFRRPAAWVHHGRHDYLVDDEAVRLPGTYRQGASFGSGMIAVWGGQSPPPDVGMPWDDSAVSRVVQLASALKSEPYAGQIFVARLTRQAASEPPELVLITDRDDSRIRWGSLPGDEAADENRAIDKLTLLSDMYEETGRVDRNSAFVDLTLGPDRVGASADKSNWQGPAVIRPG